jgi:hypothetical protein
MLSCVSGKPKEFQKDFCNLAQVGCFCKPKGNATSVFQKHLRKPLLTLFGGCFGAMLQSEMEREALRAGGI